MEEDILSKKIKADQEYFNKLIVDKISEYITPDIAVSTLINFLNDDESVLKLANIKNINPDFIKYNEMVHLKIVSVITAIYLNDLQEYNEFRITNERLLDALIISDFNILESSTIFLSNPVISNVISAIYASKEGFKDTEGFYNKMINNIVDSLKGVIELFNEKMYMQAMFLFRQALEHFITLKALDMNKNAMESYMYHQRITAAEVLGEFSQDDLDKFIVDNNLTYNTYKSYMNYGWLDSVEAFAQAKKEKPKLKYSIKTIAEITGQQEFYEAMDFASNYVHPNFIFVNVNWNMVLIEVLDGIYQILDWILELSIKEGKPCYLYGENSIELYKKYKEYAKELFKNENYNFNIK